MKKSILIDKSKAFALRIIKMTEFIQTEKKEYILSKQVLRSGTSIGANVHEAFFGQSLPDFISKLSIALKECGETQYWLELLYESDKMEENHFKSIFTDCEEMGKLLTTSIKTARGTLEKRKSKSSSNSEFHEPLTDYGDTLEDLLLNFEL